MQTAIADFIKDTPEGREADRILRSCVHCGFCNATCPTYLLLGDELDGPRGRIYLIKQALEGNTVSTKSLLHLDRCLTCRNCETTCPSGVRYGELLDIGRELVEQKAKRSMRERMMRWLLRKIIPYPGRFNFLLRLGQGLRPLLPTPWRRKIPAYLKTPAMPPARHRRRMLIHTGCVQPGLAPNINIAAAKVLDRLGISTVTAPDAGCCGALSHHLSATGEALGFVRRNIDAWWPLIEGGAEALVSTASGCGVMLKDYGRLLRNDPVYAEKAARLSEMIKDIGEVLAQEDLSPLKSNAEPLKTIAFHSPCTLQHGQRLDGVTEGILTQLGFNLVEAADPHLCCGSAGAYSLLQPSLSRRLLSEKLAALQRNAPELIATANIGCLALLQTRANVPVRHWIELLAP